VESTRHAFAAQNVNGADGLREPQLRGALDVLRDGALDVLRDKKGSSTDNINETIDKIRTGFQEKVKEIDTGSRLAADRQPGQAWRATLRRP
jgi:hypothetical protein